MEFHYSLPSTLVLDAVRSESMLSMLESAGIGKIWLYGYFFGHLDAPIEKMIEARANLQDRGFDVGACSMPVGHPGNSLDPDDSTIDVRIPQHWRYRIDRHGKPVYHCADIEPRMIDDNIAAMTQMRDAGFTTVFVDDDTRQGNWGPEIQGCFCDSCLEAFNDKFHHDEDRKSLASAILRHPDLVTARDWMQFNCQKVNALIDALAMPGIELGIMVMHGGDERHGICIPELKARVKHFRVGEDHFSDTSFATSRQKASEISSMQLHIARMLPSTLYSETTAFPARTLSAKNWVFKAKMALVLGIPNIFLMGGTWLIEQNYWKAIADNLQEMRWIEEFAGSLEATRESSVHVAMGPGDFFIPSWPLLTGLPARPVLADDAIGDGIILLVLGRTMLDDAWLGKVHAYQKIILDREAAKRNTRLIDQDSTEENELVKILQPGRASNWHWSKKQHAIDEEPVIASQVRDIIAQSSSSFPFLIEGRDIWLAWIKERAIAILTNLRTETNCGILKYKEKTCNVSLEPLEIGLFHLDAAEITKIEKSS